MKTPFLVLSLALGGCAAHSNLNDTARPSNLGGFRDATLGDKLFFVEGTSGFAPVKNSGGARDTFDRRAKELCGDDRYTVLWIYEEVGTPTSFRLYKTSTCVGYVLDHDSSLTVHSAKQTINAARQQRGLFAIQQWLK